MMLDKKILEEIVEKVQMYNSTDTVKILYPNNAEDWLRDNGFFDLPSIIPIAIDDAPDKDKLYVISAKDITNDDITNFA